MIYTFKNKSNKFDLNVIDFYNFDNFFITYDGEFKDELIEKSWLIVKSCKKIPSEYQEFFANKVFEVTMIEGITSKYFGKIISEKIGLNIEESEKLAINLISQLLTYYHILRYKNLGLLYFQWQTANDSNTCKFCKEQDGKIFSLEEGANGKYPGNCPNCELGFCRCCMTPIIDNNPRARNKDGSYRKKKND